MRISDWSSDVCSSDLEAMLPEYGELGLIKQPTGGGIATAAPSNAYPTIDGDWMLIAANSEPLFAKLARLMEAPEMIDDPRFIGNAEIGRASCRERVCQYV